MSIPRDGMRESNDPAVNAWLESTSPLTKLFPVKRKRCGHLVGSVVRIDGRDLLVANARGLIHSGPDTMQARRQLFAVLLDDPRETLTLGCKESAGEVVDLTRIRAHRDRVVKGETRPGVPCVVN